MQYKPDIVTVIKRYRALWEKDLYDRPPIRIRFPISGQGDGEWTEACQKPETYFKYWDDILCARAVLADDDVPTATVDLGPAFMPGVMGCPVYFENGTSWSGHILEDWSDLEKFESVVLDERNPWVKRLKDYIVYFTDQSRGKCAVGVAMLTGPGDIITALRGPSQVCVDFYESPEEIKELAQICTKAWIAVNKFQLDLIPSIEGGYCDNYDIWTPGRNSYFADDTSILVSPGIYRDFLFPYDKQIAASLETPWMHVHSGGVRLAPEFLKIPRLVAIQVVNDRPAGQTLQEILPYLKLIQKNHVLLLRKYPMEELEEILPELSPRGLYIDTQCDSLEEAQDILARWNMRKWNKREGLD